VRTVIVNEVNIGMEVAFAFPALVDIELSTTLKYHHHTNQNAVTPVSAKVRLMWNVTGTIARQYRIVSSVVIRVARPV
jgi:hypothetical protein